MHFMRYFLQIFCRIVIFGFPSITEMVKYAENVLRSRMYCMVQKVSPTYVIYVIIIVLILRNIS